MKTIYIAILISLTLFIRCEDELTTISPPGGEIENDQIDISDITGNWHAVRVSPYSQYSDFPIEKLVVRIKDMATYCTIGNYTFDCSKTAWLCDNNNFFIELENSSFLETLKMSIHHNDVLKYKDDNLLEIQFIIPLEYLLKIITVDDLNNAYGQVRIIFERL